MELFSAMEDGQTDRQTDKTRKTRRCALTTLNEAQTRLKPLQLNGALSDRNNAGTNISVY